MKFYIFILICPPQIIGIWLIPDRSSDFRNLQKAFPPLRAVAETFKDAS